MSANTLSSPLSLSLSLSLCPSSTRTHKNDTVRHGAVIVAHTAVASILPFYFLFLPISLLLSNRLIVAPSVINCLFQCCFFLSNAVSSFPMLRQGERNNASIRIERNPCISHSSAVIDSAVIDAAVIDAAVFDAAVFDA